MTVLTSVASIVIAIVGTYLAFLQHRRGDYERAERLRDNRRSGSRPAPAGEPRVDPKRLGYSGGQRRGSQRPRRSSLPPGVGLRSDLRRSLDGSWAAAQSDRRCAVGLGALVGRRRTTRLSVRPRRPRAGSSRQGGARAPRSARRSHGRRLTRWDGPTMRTIHAPWGSSTGLPAGSVLVSDARSTSESCQP